MITQSRSLENTTVRELIEILKTMNQDAVVCELFTDEDDIDFTPYFSSLEVCEERSSELYTDDAGHDKIGDIVAFY